MFILCLFILIHTLIHAATATSIATNLSPANASLVAQLPGASNSTVFECNIFQNQSTNELIQIPTIWTLQNYNSNGNAKTLVFKSAFEGIFLIGGTPHTSGPASATFRNRLVMLNFTEKFDKSILQCSSAMIEGTREPGYFELRVYSK